VTPPFVEVAVIGGSSAGLSAALALGRARRSVAVIDDGAPRNAPAGHAHNVYTRDGTPPDVLRRIGREQLEPYGVQVLGGRVTQVGGRKGAFWLELRGGETLHAARLLLATGVSDDLPAIPGLRELWGRSVFTCPYCHGWEVRDRPVAVIGDGAMGYGYARLIHNWSRDLLLVTASAEALSGAQRDDLRGRGIEVIEAEISAFKGEHGELSTLELADGRRLERRAVFMRPPLKLRGDLAQQLGCRLSDDGLQVVVDESYETSVPGVYAAGDMVSPMHAVIVAAASGTTAAAMLNHHFVMAAPAVKAPTEDGLEIEAP
jgi:thioredoxin reductase